MKSKTLLIVFSYKYPYDPPVEQFLDDEIRYLAKEDIDILLVPVSRDKFTTQYEFVQNSEHICIRNLGRRHKGKEIVSGIAFLFMHGMSFVSDLIRSNHNVSPQYKRFAIKDTLKYYIQGGALLKELKMQLKDIDIDKYHNVVLYSYWLSPMVLAEALSKKYILSKYSVRVYAYSRAHGDGDLYHKGLENFRPCLRYLNEYIDAFFPISNGGNIYLHNQGFNSVETFRLGVKGYAEYRSKNNAIPLIISCSVMNHNKRVDKIAEIISLINRPVKWIHFGGGSCEKEIIKYCTNNFSNNVIWEIKGWTSHEEVLKYYEDNYPDLFINASIIEGIPVSIMEAMSYSIPCIATNVGATNEIIDDGENGFLIPSDFDTKSVAEIINCYFDYQDDKKEKMKKKAYLTYINKYSASENYSAFSKRIVAYR